MVAVVGLRPRCGATVVARALAAELAARDPGGAAAVTVGRGRGRRRAARPARRRAASRARSRPSRAARRGRAAGCAWCRPPTRVRLADATRYLAPLVLDVGDPQEAPAAAAVAGTVVLVGGPGRASRRWPTLVAESLARVGPGAGDRVRVARATSAGGPLGAVALPDSRVGARLALAGREPRGELGARCAIWRTACLEQMDAPACCAVSPARRCCWCSAWWRCCSPGCSSSPRSARRSAARARRSGRLTCRRCRPRARCSATTRGCSCRRCSRTGRRTRATCRCRSTSRGRAARRPAGARRNGARVGLGDVTFPGASFAPTRVRVRIRDSVRVNVDGPASRRRRRAWP